MKPTILLILATTTLLTAPTQAQWPPTPSTNLPLATASADQVVPHLAITPKNSAYAGWYDNSTGNYNVNLQLIAADGTEQWAHGGITVSAHPQNSWVMDWSLISDSAGNAIVSFADIRGGNSNIHVYKIAPDGTFIWGPNGIDVTDNSDDKGPPSLVETNGGDIIVAWFASPGAGSPVIRVQRYSENGTPIHAAGGVIVSEAGDSAPSGQAMVPCDDDDFMLGYVPSYTFMSNRQIKLQRFDSLAQPVWTNYLMVMDNSTVPMGHYFQMVSDGQDGACFSWSAATGLAFSVLAQHVSADGTESFTHNGVSGSTSATYSQISPDVAFDPVTGDLSMFFIQMDSNQSQKGVFGQRFSPAGARLWGNGGVQIVPVDSSNEGFVRTLNTTDGVAGVFFQAPGSVYGQDQVVGFKVDTNGAFLWDPTTTAVSTALSGKDDLLAVTGTDGIARIIWTDDRNGTADVYGQNLNPDGSLGNLLSAVGNTPAAAMRLAQNHPNPFNPATDIAFELASRQHVTLQVFDTRGRLVRTLLSGEAGPGTESVHWDGHDLTGAAVPSGVYFYQINGSKQTVGRKMVLVR